jgi:hypothetical protein
MSFPDWVDAQVRAAEASGAFDNLAGKGKPIPGIERRQDEMTWIANWLRRENVEVAGLLPPQLALAKEVEDLPYRLLTERSERDARAVVEELNARISAAHAAPQTGPPLRVKLVDVDAAVAEWRAARAAIAASRSETASMSTPVAPPAPRRRWWSRRR